MSDDNQDNPDDSISEPIEIRIPGYSGKKKFTTWGEVREFVAAELEAWQWLNEYVRQPPPLGVAAAHQVNNVNNMANWAQQLSANPESAPANAEQNLREHLGRYAKGDLVFSKTEDGQFICKLAEDRPEEAVGALASLLPGQWNLDPKTMRHYVRGTSELITSRVKPEGVARAAASLEALRDDWAERLDEQMERLRQYGQEIETAQARVKRFWLDQCHSTRKLFRESRQEKAAIETAYREEMRLKAPVKYWTNKANDHARAARRAFFAFGIFVALGILLFVTNVESIRGLISTENPIGSIVLVTIPALAFFWFLRFIARIFVSNLERHHDARERATMVETYIALLAEGEKVATDQERALILHALFRPGPGDAPEDAPPANLLDILKEMSARRTTP